MTAEPTESPTRARSQHQRRKRIVQAAAALASRGGVDAMQMRTVAERAGVALGTLYRYFPSKMELVVAVVSEELDLLEKSMQRRPPATHGPAESATELLMRATRGLMREPELADALTRSLMLSEVDTDFGSRLTGMMLRVMGVEETATEEQRSLVHALGNVWSMEMIDLLRGRTTPEQIQARLELVANRLLADF
jgi:AcrR family transcriptional regulator